MLRSRNLRSILFQRYYFILQLFFILGCSYFILQLFFILQVFYVM
jgi:hypothetical protein